MRFLWLGVGVNGAKGMGQGREASLSSLQRAKDKIQTPGKSHKDIRAGTGQE